jgi:hypothetical protein
VPVPWSITPGISEQKDRAQPFDEGVVDATLPEGGDAVSASVPASTRSSPIPLSLKYHHAYSSAAPTRTGTPLTTRRSPDRTASICP